MIDAIGHMVFRNALREVAGWRDRFDPAFTVGVNNSPVQFQEKYRLHQRCLEELSAAGLHPSAVVMEITEGVLMSSDAYTRVQLHDFQQSGFGLAIDDFGTGYSSLSYLKKFAVDYLKIDRSFTAQLAPGSNDLALCEAIVVMAHKLELKVIAEGVETGQQHELLRGIGCDFGQGYYYARPMTAEAMERFMEGKAGAP
jgi:EAL domain-containing protein (putative c-di-GMP-specific phosphodiesterase class I)